MMKDDEFFRRIKERDDLERLLHALGVPTREFSGRTTKYIKANAVKLIVQAQYYDCEMCKGFGKMKTFPPAPHIGYTITKPCHYCGGTGKSNRKKHESA